MTLVKKLFLPVILTAVSGALIATLLIDTCPAPISGSMAQSQFRPDPAELKADADLVVRGVVRNVKGFLGFAHADVPETARRQEVLIQVTERFKGTYIPARDAKCLSCTVVQIMAPPDDPLARAGDFPQPLIGQEVVVFVKLNQFEWFPGWSVAGVTAGWWVVDQDEGVVEHVTGKVELQEFLRKVRPS